MARISQVAMASQGHTAHQAEPRKKTEIISPVHQIFQVNSVAMFLSGIWEPDNPAVMTSMNRHTIINLNATRTAGLVPR